MWRFAKQYVAFCKTVQTSHRFSIPFLVGLYFCDDIGRSFDKKIKPEDPVIVWKSQN